MPRSDRIYDERAPQYVRRPNGDIVEVHMRALVGQVASPVMRPRKPQPERPTRRAPREAVLASPPPAK